MIASPEQERLFDNFAAVFCLILASFIGDFFRNGDFYVSEPFYMFLDSDSASWLFNLSVWGTFFVDFEFMLDFVATFDEGTNKWFSS